MGGMLEKYLGKPRDELRTKGGRLRLWTAEPAVVASEVEGCLDKDMAQIPAP